MNLATDVRMKCVKSAHQYYKGMWEADNFIRPTM